MKYYNTIKNYLQFLSINKNTVGRVERLHEGRNDFFVRLGRQLAPSLSRSWR
jgi:hypothetical protein